MESDLVVAPLHVPDGGLGMNVGSAGDAVNAGFVDVVVVIIILDKVERA